MGQCFVHSIGLQVDSQLEPPTHLDNYRVHLEGRKLELNTDVFQQDKCHLRMSLIT